MGFYKPENNEEIYMLLGIIADGITDSALRDQVVVVVVDAELDQPDDRIELTRPVARALMGCAAGRYLVEVMGDLLDCENAAWDPDEEDIEI